MFLVATWWQLCVSTTTYRFSVKGNTLCVQSLWRHRSLWRTPLPSLSGFSFGCRFVISDTVSIKTGTSWTSCEKASFLTGTECERFTERPSITPSAPCWTAWRTFNRSPGRKSDRRSSICCLTTKVSGVYFIPSANIKNWTQQQWPQMGEISTM